MENRNWRRAYASGAAAIIFFFICLWAFDFLDCMEGGCAIAFISFFLSISGVAVSVLFVYHATTMDTILNGTRLLAHWVYPAEDAQQAARREYRDFQERNHFLFILTGGMLGVAILFFLIFVNDGGIETAAILFVVLIIIFIVSKVTPGLELKRALGAPHEAYIADNGIIYEGAVYPFRSFMMKMESVAFMKGRGRKPPMLVFSFVQLIGLSIISPFDIPVPVPEGQEERASEIARVLGGNVEGDTAFS
jgi:hypothetical protein